MALDLVYATTICGCSECYHWDGPPYCERAMRIHAALLRARDDGKRLNEKPSRDLQLYAWLRDRDGNRRVYASVEERYHALIDDLEGLRGQPGYRSGKVAWPPGMEPQDAAP